MDKVSVVIPSYNRFNYLLNAIESVKNQSYCNIEIIVVNDCSSEKEYYEYDWKANDIKIIHLEQNTKEIFGFACAGFVRNQGIIASTGTWVAFCDDDDIWLPNKLILQLKKMAETGCKMSCTEGFIGTGIYDPYKKYLKFCSEANIKQISKIFRKNKKFKLIANGIPNIINLKLLEVHNICICSSIIVEKNILTKIDNFKNMKPPGEDYDCWLRALNHTACAFVDEPCVYYDNGHGNGQNY